MLNKDSDQQDSSTKASEPSDIEEKAEISSGLFTVTLKRHEGPLVSAKGSFRVKEKEPSKGNGSSRLIPPLFQKVSIIFMPKTGVNIIELPSETTNIAPSLEEQKKT
jgi:hypothetical protein